MPLWDVRERHSILVDAPGERILAALREVTLGELPVSRALFRLRGLGGAAGGSVLDQLPRGIATLADDPGRELVLGAVGRPWRPGGGMVPGADPRAFETPGYARMALAFEFAGGELSTETRVLCTDAASRRRFRLYWLVVRPFSGLIRREWLRAIKRRAEG